MRQEDRDKRTRQMEDALQWYGVGHCRFTVFAVIASSYTTK